MSGWGSSDEDDDDMGVDMEAMKRLRTASEQMAALSNDQSVDVQETRSKELEAEKLKQQHDERMKLEARRQRSPRMQASPVPATSMKNIKPLMESGSSSNSSRSSNSVRTNHQHQHQQQQQQRQQQHRVPPVGRTNVRELTRNSCHLQSNGSSSSSNNDYEKHR